MKKRVTSQVKIRREASSQDVADALTVNVDTVRQWAAMGCPHDVHKGATGHRFDLGEVAAWMKANGVTGKQGRPPEVDSPDLEKARLRKENALASKYELQVAKEKRLLVPIEDVKAQFMEEVTRAKGRMIGLGADVAGQCEGLDAPEIQGVIDGRVSAILNDLAVGLN